MRWLESYFSFLFMRPWEELKRSRWYTVFIVLPMILNAVTLVGIFINVRIPLPPLSTQTWLILFLLSIIITLLLLIEGLRRYDLRTAHKLNEEWASHSKAINVISGLIATGKHLLGRCQRPDYEKDVKLFEEIDYWQRNAASALVHRADLPSSYRERFYNDSDTGKKTPPINECLSWMDTRVALLEEFRDEINKPPLPLVFQKDRQRVT